MTISSVGETKRPRLAASGCKTPVRPTQKQSSGGRSKAVGMAANTRGGRSSMKKNKKRKKAKKKGPGVRNCTTTVVSIKRPRRDV